MLRKHAMLVTAAVLAAVSPATPFAQSPYAGNWSGSFSETLVLNCTATGSDVAIAVSNCTFSQPWTGSADTTGMFSLFKGAGTLTCTNSVVPTPQTTPIAADTTASVSGLIDGNGQIAFPAFNNTSTVNNTTTTIACNPFAYQFSGGSMSASDMCTTSSHTTDPGGTQDCSGTTSASYTGSKGGGSVVLTPPKVVFPISVSSNISTTSATATATVSPPSAQVGTTGSVYVFAHARLSTIPGAKREAALIGKDGSSPDPCVLAQLNSSGQLTVASASTMQAYTTGVLSSQSQSVSVLNNVPTPNVAGATFMVGYGANPSDMLASGNYEGAVSVNGASPCSAALLASAAPLSPSGLSGLWWNSSESGWGIGLVQRRNVVFGAWYTYDAAGKPKWYVASNCALPDGNNGTSGTCTGTLYQVTGPTFFGATFNPALRQVASVGSLSIAFQDANNATMNWTVNGLSRSVPIIREQFWTGTTPPAIDYTDLWWNPNESGWGMVITQQYGVMFLAWYVYDGSGNPVWYVAPDCTLAGSSCSGTVYATTGPPLGPTFDHNAVQAAAVGSITANFLDANNASITYTVNGTAATKAITRETF